MAFRYSDRILDQIGLGRKDSDTPLRHAVARKVAALGQSQIEYTSRYHVAVGTKPQ